MMCSVALETHPTELDEGTADVFHRPLHNNELMSQTDEPSTSTEQHWTPTGRSDETLLGLGKEVVSLSLVVTEVSRGGGMRWWR